MPVTETNPFPRHDIDPKQKNYDWILKFAKACWNDFNTRVPQTMFWHAAADYTVTRQYAMGQQSINKYKPLLRVDDANNDAWMNIDWSVVPILPKFRRSILSKLNKTDYNIWCQAIDRLAQQETGDYMAKMAVKVMMRDQMAAIAPEMVEEVGLGQDPGEPATLEELAIQMGGDWKHQMAIEAEQGIKLVFEQNDMREIRKQVRKDIIDLGVGGYKEWIENGAIKIRKVSPKNIITSYCRRPDFRDSLYMGEIVEMTFSELKQMAGSAFTDEEYEKIAKMAMGRWSNPRPEHYYTVGFRNNYDALRIRILDVEFYSVNDYYYEERVNKYGNRVVGKTGNVKAVQGDKKLHKLCPQVVYKAKWILDTDMMFDYGLQTDMKRTASNLMDTSFSYHLYAADFDEMTCTSLVKQCIPIADQIQLAWYKLQNVINQARPKGIMIEIGALEDIPLGANGKKLTPLQVLDLFDKRGDLIYRKIDAQGRQSNYKPIEELENGLGKDAIVFYDIIQRSIQMLRDILGFNELTDGSTPGERTLTTVAEMAYEGTNNALGIIIEADRYLLESVAKSVVVRLQDVVANKQFSGYIRSLGENTMKFIELSPKLALHEFGVMLRDKPTDDQRQRLLQRLEQYKANGLLEPDDEFLIENTDNLKVAEQILAYRVKKRKEEMRMKAMEEQQMNAQVQQQSAMAAEQAKQQTLQIEMEKEVALERERRATEEMKKMWDYKIAELKLTSAAAPGSQVDMPQDQLDGMQVDPQLFANMSEVADGYAPPPGPEEVVEAAPEDQAMGPVPFV